MIRHPEANFFEWKWLFIPILERRGMRLNEGWFSHLDSLVQMAKSLFREPTEEQYEWTFPFKSDGYQWTYARPETNAIKRVLISEKPDLLCGLHHSGFYDTYFYFSRDLPEAYPKLRKLATELGLPISQNSADVPFAKELSSGFYQMYGVKDYIEYYRQKEPERLLTLRRGASSDEWFEKTVGGFSFNCEVPLIKSSFKKTNEYSDRNLLTFLEKKKQTTQSTFQFCENHLFQMEPYFPFANPLVLNSVLKQYATEKVAIEHIRKQKIKVHDRKATFLEIFENEIMFNITNLNLLGQIWRVTEQIYIKTNDPKIYDLLNKIDQKISKINTELLSQGSFNPIPINRLIKMQIGTTLIITELLDQDY